MDDSRGEIKYYQHSILAHAADMIVCDINSLRAPVSSQWRSTISAHRIESRCLRDVHTLHVCVVVACGRIYLGHTASHHRRQNRQLNYTATVDISAILR